MPDLKDHLANERTFLAWIRTSIGIMAFGFVVEKFALFMEEVNLLLGKDRPLLVFSSPHLQGYSNIFGVLLVALGVFICLLAFAKFKIVEKQIEDEKYRPSHWLNILITIVVVLVGIFLIVYL